MNRWTSSLAGCFLAVAARAQTPNVEFEVASVRAMGAVPGSAAGRVSGGPGTSDPERITYSRVAMLRLLRTAFGGVPADQISAASSVMGWVMEGNTDGAPRFEIQAKVPAGATAEQVPEMLRSLLIERFGLRFHVQQKTFDAYNLVVAPGGPRLTAAEQPNAETPKLDLNRQIPADSDGFPIVPAGLGKIVFNSMTDDGTVRYTGRMVAMPAITAAISMMALNPHVTDKTGLNGDYDFRLTLAGGNPPPDLNPALQKQLGLKLEKVKAPFDFIVIDQIAKEPAEQ